jgi:hypothetical protein
MICQGRVADAAAGEEEHGEHDDVVDVGAGEDAGAPRRRRSSADRFTVNRYCSPAYVVVSAPGRLPTVFWSRCP